MTATDESRSPGALHAIAGDRSAAVDTQLLPGLVVVKLGGTTLSSQERLLDDLAALARQRPLLVVHGGGKLITAWLDRLGVATRFEDGLRVTDDETLAVTAGVLRGLVGTELVAALRARGCDAVGVSGVDGGLLVGERLPRVGRVATVTGVRPDLVVTLLTAGLVPVVAPLALDEAGAVCNVNADDAAAGLARGLGAELLVLLTDVDGVRGADGERISSMTPAEAGRLIDQGVIAGGMIPKVRAALRAIEETLTEAVIGDGADPTALERALRDPGFGTRIAAGAAEEAGAAREPGAALAGDR
jgi:acetylglutamate kinase